MKLYFADVGGGGLYCTTMQEASRYAESILKDYGFAVSIWRVNTKRITPEVFCSTVNGGGHTAFSKDRTLVRTVQPKGGK